MKRQRGSVPPLVMGEFANPAAAVQIARERFWRAIPIAPSSRRAFEALYAKVLPDYRAAVESRLGRTLPTHHLAAKSPEHRAAVAFLFDAQKLPSLRKWSEHWQLNEPWCHYLAAYTLLLWVDDPEDAAALSPPAEGIRLFAVGGVLRTGPDPVRAFAHVQCWIPTAQTWVRYEASVVRAVRAYLRNQYRPEMQARWRGALGGELPKRPSERFTGEHFLWAVRCRVGGEKPGAIATASRGIRFDAAQQRKRPVAESTVRTRVERLLEFILERDE
jgi:hypothetical protein